MSWVDIAEGARLADTVKHLVLYVLTANHATTVRKRDFERFIGDIGAHLAEPKTVEAPKPFVCRHVKFTATVSPEGKLVVNVSRPLVKAGDPGLIIPHHQPYPNASGEELNYREWRFTVT